ncbi:hypothetical protein HZR84_05980 [Hyphobacterium sp. CCMP332]|nr:hypothetical protein HZR84_05980 [Hyphobacterium sp. CCMP332]
MYNLPYDKDELGFFFVLSKNIEWDQSTKSLESIYDNLKLVDLTDSYKKEFDTEGDLKKLKLIDFFGDNEPFTKACLEKALDEKSFEIQFSEEESKDKYKYYLGRYSINTDKNKQIESFSGVIDKITIDQYYERKLQNLSDELNRRIRELHNINFATSHRVRSPLARIMGLIEIMKLEDKYDPYMEMLEKSSKELDKEIRRFIRILEQEKPPN